MSRLVGSGIAQGPNVGRIDRWSKWTPTDESTLWLLLSGASNPPENIEISKRRPRDDPGGGNGAFLDGVTHDLANMEYLVRSKLYNTVKDLYLTKDRAFEHITKLFKICKDKEAVPMLYYTGHGETGTGNWCFANGTISIEEISNLLPVDCFYPSSAMHAIVDTGQIFVSTTELKVLNILQRVRNTQTPLIRQVCSLYIIPLL
ncbi:hypothetical protein ABFA07_020915 [Porites harrisoni]